MIFHLSAPALVFTMQQPLALVTPPPPPT